MENEKSVWFKNTELGSECFQETHCSDCNPNGVCDTCDTIDGRYTESLSDYASTCDECGNLTPHESMVVDPETQLGYCERCFNSRIPQNVIDRIFDDFKGGDLFGDSYKQDID